MATFVGQILSPKSFSSDCWLNDKPKGVVNHFFSLGNMPSTIFVIEDLQPMALEFVGAGGRDRSATHARTGRKVTFRSSQLLTWL